MALRATVAVNRSPILRAPIKRGRRRSTSRGVVRSEREVKQRGNAERELGVARARALVTGEA